MQYRYIFINYTILLKRKLAKYPQWTHQILHLAII